MWAMEEQARSELAETREPRKAGHASTRPVQVNGRPFTLRNSRSHTSRTDFGKSGGKQ